MAYPIPSDRILTVPLLWTNAAGAVVAPPAGSPSAAVSDPALATVSASETEVVVTPTAASGAFTVTFTDGQFSAIADFEIAPSIAEITPTAVAFDLANATLAPKV